MEIVFLGTSSMVPTKDRNQYSLFISYKTEGILVDCGEGTQRQFKIAKIPLPKITKILITHWHGDHVLGLPGLIQTLAASRYERTLEIYGPKGSKKRFEHMYKTFIFDRAHDIKVIEVEEGVVFENNDYRIEAFALEHGTLCFGYTFIEKDKRKIQMTKAKKLGLKQGPLIGKLQNGESIRLKGKVIRPDDISKVAKGKKIAIIADTLPCKNLVSMAKDADVLICEATYVSDLEEKATEYRHMTAEKAAQVANKANVDKLILTHFSARYKDIGELEADAKKIFPKAVAAWDFMKVKL